MTGRDFARGKATLLPCLAVLLLGWAAGCGGGESTAKESDPLAGYPNGPTRQFIVPGADNMVQEYGREATRAERLQASAVISAWLEARAAREWERECRYFHRAVAAHEIRSASFNVGHQVGTCGQAIHLLAEEGAPQRRKDNLRGPVTSLRIGEGRGFAQYHGTDGHDWVVAVRREAGKWKVAVLDPIGRFN